MPRAAGTCIRTVFLRRYRADCFRALREYTAGGDDTERVKAWVLR